jgi:hypothetical protein
MKELKLPASAVRAALPVVTIVGAVVAGVVFGVEISLLVVAAGALAGVIALLWASVQALTGESPLTLDEALTLGAPSAEEEQKRAILRALKDLEFERGVGKITEEDYAELSARYRADAKRLMQLIDAGSEAERERVEKALKARLEKAANAPEPAVTTDLDAHATDAESKPDHHDAPEAESKPDHHDAPERDADVAPESAPPPAAKAAPREEEELS